MRRVLLLALLTAVNARKNFRTGDLPLRFDGFTASEESIEVQNVTRLEPKFVESSRESTRLPTRKPVENEEEKELARIIAEEQKKIEELRIQREKMKAEQAAEIRRIMKEQAEEKARIEAAREERRRKRVLEEQRRMLEEAKKERERQERLNAQLARQKEEEIKRLEEEKEKERLRAEQERKVWLEEEKRRVEEEERIRKEREEEEQRRMREMEEKRRRKEEEEKRAKEMEEKRRREEEEERRAREMEEKHRREEEERKMREVEEKRRRKEEEERNRRLKEEKRKRAEALEKERRKAEKEKKRREMEQELQRKREEEQRRKELQEEKKRWLEKEMRLKEERERQKKKEEEAREREEEERLGREIERKQLAEQETLNSLKKKHQMEERRMKSQFSIDAENRDFRKRNGGFDPEKHLPHTHKRNLSKRRLELLSRFGSASRAKQSSEEEDETEDGDDAESQEERDVRIAHENPTEIPSRAQHGNLHRVQLPISDPDVKTEQAGTQFRVKNLPMLEVQNNPLPERVPTSGALVRKSLKKTLQGIRTFNSDQDSKTESHGTTFGSSYQTVPTDQVAVLVQPVLVPESVPSNQNRGQDMVVTVQQIPAEAVDDEYLRAYYEQYYNEWYKQHNEAAATAAVPPVAIFPTAVTTEAPPRHRKISIKMGKMGLKRDETTPPTQSSLFSSQSITAQFGAMTPGTATTLTAEQMDKICVDVRKTTTGFGIRDPKTFALNNCPLIQMYYKQVTCEQINHVMAYCEQRSLL
ncbi:unnamed protein product [Nippostrongylus brasiliensis]|uniref:UPF0430 protein CG31712 n=1 Tax=Nippostrongylus brasiliensis TaxID=27835 RepID=A0A0N4XYS7_NIPBR|nr:unnamed protein product [Nippostrongylus brasiliensis]